MRYIKQGVVRDGYGSIIPNAVIKTYLAGTTTPATVYLTETGGTGVTQLTADDYGSFIFYVDDADYATIQLFKIVLSNGDRYSEETWDNIPIFNTSSATKINTINIVQATHGFAVGNILYLDGTIYKKAIATDAEQAEVIGIVNAVADINKFRILLYGDIDNLTGLTAGAVYFLSDTVAGEMTTDEPIADGHVSKPLFSANSSTAGYFFNMRGAVINVEEMLSVAYGGTGKSSVTLNSYLKGNGTGALIERTYGEVLTDLGIGTVIDYQGTIDCSGNPNYPAADKGHYYIVSVSGKIGGASGDSVTAGMSLLCNADSTPSGTKAEVGAYWSIVGSQSDFSSPPPIGNTTANTGAFTTLTCTTANGISLAKDATDMTIAGVTLPLSNATGTIWAASSSNVFDCISSSTGTKYLKNDAGTITWEVSPALIATDTIWDASGDLVQGTGANTAAKLTKGAEGTILRAGEYSCAWTTVTQPSTVAAGSILVANTANALTALTSTTGTKYLKNTAGTLSWDTVAAAAGGNTTEVQFNLTGALTGNPYFAWDNTNLLLNLGAEPGVVGRRGRLGIQMGASTSLDTYVETDIPSLRVDIFEKSTPSSVPYFYDANVIYHRRNGGTGNRNSLHVKLESVGATITNMMCPILGEGVIYSGSGHAFGLNGYATVLAAADADSNCVGIEANTQVERVCARKVGIQVVDVGSAVANAGGTIDAGIYFARNNANGTALGYQTGLLFEASSCITNLIKLGTTFVVNVSGEITSGSWKGTAIPVAYGGTGQTSGYNNSNWDTAYYEINAHHTDWNSAYTATSTYLNQAVKSSSTPSFNGVTSTSDVSLSNEVPLKWRNGDGSAYVQMMRLTSGNALVIGQQLASGKLYLNIDGTPKQLSIDVNGFVKAA